jgi:predicted AAA+ superfamily ATPase
MIDPARLFKRGAITAESAKFLVGRRDLISDIGDRLAEDNFSAIIYGVRGVGKTTLAWQVIGFDGY